RMAVLRIQHAVSEFDSWKRMFDIDPIGRKALKIEIARKLGLGPARPVRPARGRGPSCASRLAARGQRTRPAPGSRS
ncbi:MAG: hypothetical protein L0Y54_17605, partial [Sporichthyaceae bacterium]|nr:hypothetical protein [Sporichthyaceae bacterium]